MAGCDQLGKMNLLLIEDDDWIRDSLKLYFEIEGCHVVTAETAEAGWDVVAERDFDIIITDYRLPGVNGIEFVERLPAIRKDALTILISPYWSRDVIARAHGAGIHETVFKPVNLEKIESLLKRLIKEKGFCPENR